MTNKHTELSNGSAQRFRPPDQLSNVLQHNQFTLCLFDQNKMTNNHNRGYICTYMCFKISSFTSYKVEIDLSDCIMFVYNLYKTSL